MKKLNFIFILLLLCCMFVITCGDDDSPSSDDKKVDKTVNNLYTAAGSHGDVINYTINENEKTYTWTNETTNENGSGSFTVSEDANLKGVYEVLTMGKSYYAVELAEKVYVTSEPSGNSNNKLVVGISAELDLSTDYSASDLAGKYLFIVIDGKSNSETVWGGYEVKSDHTYTWKRCTYDGTTGGKTGDPKKHFNSSSSFAGHEGSTTSWSVDSNNPSRIIFKETGQQDAIGTIYPGKAMLLDGGPGQGFTIGIKYPDTHITQSNIAGTYRYLDIDLSSGSSGIGFYTIPSSGNNVSYYYKYQNNVGEGSGTGKNLEPISPVNNMFKMDTNENGTEIDSYFILLPGEMLMHFNTTHQGDLISYGIGAQIN